MDKSINNHEQDADREAIFVEIVASMRRDFPTSEIAKMSDEQAAETAESWANHLKYIPTVRLMGIYKSLALGSKFPPTVSEFANLWSEMFIQERERKRDEKRRQEDEEAKRQHRMGVGRIGSNIAAMGMKRLEAGLDVVSCDCVMDDDMPVVAGLTGDEEYFCCAKRLCQFRARVSRLMEIRVHPNFRPVPGAIAPLAGRASGDSESAALSVPLPAPPKKAKPVDIDDDVLISQLETRCEMDCSVIGRSRAIKFGRFLLKNNPVFSTWSQESAREAWGEFRKQSKAQTERKKKAKAA